VKAFFVYCCGVTINVVIECGFHSQALLFCDFVIIVHECGGIILFMSVAEVLRKIIVFKCKHYKKQR
jgi:hypothetical protein